MALRHAIVICCNVSPSRGNALLWCLSVTLQCSVKVSLRHAALLCNDVSPSRCNALLRCLSATLQHKDHNLAQTAGVCHPVSLSRCNALFTMSLRYAAMLCLRYLSVTL